MYLVFDLFIHHSFIQSSNRHEQSTHSVFGWGLGVGVELWTRCVFPAHLLESLSDVGACSLCCLEWLVLCFSSVQYKSCS